MPFPCAKDQHFCFAHFFSLNFCFHPFPFRVYSVISTEFRLVIKLRIFKWNRVKRKKKNKDKLIRTHWINSDMKRTNLTILKKNFKTGNQMNLRFVWTACNDNERVKKENIWYWYLQYMQTHKHTYTHTNSAKFKLFAWITWIFSLSGLACKISDDLDDWFGF